MKIQAHIALLCALCGGALFSAPVDYASEPTFKWVPTRSKKGNWCDVKNWQPQKIPSGKVVVFCAVPGTVAVIDKTVPELSRVIVGSTGSAPVLLIEKGAELRLTSTLRAGVHEDNSSGAIEMTGGLVEVKGKWSVLQVGRTLTNSTQGVMTMSGGLLRGVLVVGSPPTVTASGKLLMKGSEAKIADYPGVGSTLLLDHSGEIAFVLDANGGARIDYPDRVFEIKKGARVSVDASAYQGKTGRITLMTAARFQGRSVLEMLVTGHPAQGSAEIGIDDSSKPQTLYVRISGQKPKTAP